MTQPDYSELMALWGLSFDGEEGDEAIQGSPERTVARTVIRDGQGSRWILERIAPDDVTRKQEIALRLSALNASGMPNVHPFLCAKNGELTVDVDSGSWMLRPFLEGVKLQRPDYLQDLWRADAMANWLLQLREHTKDRDGPVFSIADYAEERMSTWRRQYPRLAEKLEYSFSRLRKNFFPVHSQLPVAFCHGDYHPLNIVWGRHSIRSVIDWEFCGQKPELYDAALLLGCFGFDDPDSLISEISIQLVRILRDSGIYSEKSWRSLFELMATIRFGWMSEWIRRKDHDAIDMEILYMEILLSQKEFIRSKWMPDRNG